jgi:hypothetical protein
MRTVRRHISEYSNFNSKRHEYLKPQKMYLLFTPDWSIVKDDLELNVTVIVTATNCIPQHFVFA